MSFAFWCDALLVSFFLKIVVSWFMIFIFEVFLGKRTKGSKLKAVMIGFTACIIFETENSAVRLNVHCVDPLLETGF